MRPLTARRLALAALVPALLVLCVIPGCSNEGEGERCGDPDGTVTNNDDCGTGLTCTPFKLSDGDTIGRCCYTDHHVTDSRCLMSSGVNATGSAGASNTAGASSTAGAGQAGATAELAGAGGA